MDGDTSRGNSSDDRHGTITRNEFMSDDKTTSPAMSGQSDCLPAAKSAGNAGHPSCLPDAPPPNPFYRVQMFAKLTNFEMSVDVAAPGGQITRQDFDDACYWWELIRSQMERRLEKDADSSRDG